MADRQPLTPAQRARDSEARKVERGGRRIPGGVLPPEAAAALAELQAREYAPSAAGCIARALVAAAKVARREGMVSCRNPNRTELTGNPPRR